MPLARLSGVRRGAGKVAIKRVVDVAFSSLALVFLAPALVAAIAIAIRLDSPGPILFKQRRHGYLNEEVVVWKFRSMRTEATDHTTAARQGHRRRRPARHRRSSLPAPHEPGRTAAALERRARVRCPWWARGRTPVGMLTGGSEASTLIETYAHRHRMKPGLTGWAAVNGSRGPVDTADAVRRRVSLDLEYVERQSIWLDLSIMLRTLPVVLGDTQTVR